MYKLRLYIADVYAVPKAQQQELCLDTAPRLLDVGWQGTKCFKTMRKRDKPDSNCSCACGALGKLQTKTALMVNWWFGAPVFWNPIGFHLSARDSLVGGPIPKMPKPLSPIHRSKNRNRLIRIKKGTTGRPTTGHIRDPQLQVASIVTRCSLGHFEAPKSTPQVGSGAKTSFLIVPVSLVCQILWGEPESKHHAAKVMIFPTRTSYDFRAHPWKLAYLPIGLILLLQAVIVEWAVAK